MPLTREEMQARVTQISEMVGDNADVMNLLREINNNYGEVLTSAETLAQNQTVVEDIQDTDGVKWRDKYATLRSEYRDRFFSEPIEPFKQKPTPKTFNDLFNN